MLAGLTLAASLAVAGTPDADRTSPRLSLDVVRTEVSEIARALAEAGGYQAVIDDVPSCRPSLRVSQAPWDEVMEHVLGACGLAAERQGRVLWITQASRLAERRARERQLATRGSPAPAAPAFVPLSYASATEMATTLRALLPEGVEVVPDARTNTLIVVGPR